MPPQEPARHRTIVVVDVAGFTDQARTMIHQAAVHQGLYEVLTTAFADAGVDLSVCTLEDRGDGALILVPPDVPKSLIAGKLPGMLGEHHPNSLSAAVNFAVTLRQRGDAAVARQLNERSLEQFRATLGPDHPHAIVCGIDLASDLAVMGESEGALALGTEMLDRAVRVLGPDHPTTLAASLNVSLDLRALGRAQDAEKRYIEVLVHNRRVLGAAHPATKAAVKRVRADCDIDPLPF